MVNTWFSADLHFGHRNIVQYCGRPYPDVDAMNAGLVARWNAVVAPKDDVWVLGDVAMGRIQQSLEFVAQLHGRLHLVTGNHDRCWPGEDRDRHVSPHDEDDHDRSRRVTKWEARYRDAGFTDIHHGVVRLTLDQSGPTVLACHFPYEGDSQDTDRYPGARPDDHGDWLLHGHVHEVWRQHGRMINVGVDAWGGVPVSSTTLAALVATGENDLAPLPWARTTGVPA